MRLTAAAGHAVSDLVGDGSRARAAADDGADGAHAERGERLVPRLPDGVAPERTGEHVRAGRARVDVGQRARAQEAAGDHRDQRGCGDRGRRRAVDRVRLRGKPEPKQNVVTPPVTVDAASTAVVPPVVDAAAVEVATPDAAEAAVPDKTPPPTDCTVEVSSTPPGAEIVKDKEVLGDDADEGHAAVRRREPSCSCARAKLGSVTRVVKATDGMKLKLKLGKTMFSVKVTSTPAGATITVGGKSRRRDADDGEAAGVRSRRRSRSRRPATRADTQKVTPKPNNQAHHVVLKKGSAARGRRASGRRRARARAP